MLLKNHNQLLLHYTVQEKPNKKEQKYSYKIRKKQLISKYDKIARSNLNKNEKNALKSIKSWDDTIVTVQVKEFQFFILENEVYEEKPQQQSDSSSFKELKDHLSQLF